MAQRDRLIKHLEKIMDDKNSKCLIFTGTKRTADDITMFLRKDGWPCLAIHGDKQQNERDWVLNEFKTGKSPIMVATDVASRGIGMIYLRAFYFPTPFPRDASPFLSCEQLLYSPCLPELEHVLPMPVSVGFRQWKLELRVQ